MNLVEAKEILGNRSNWELKHMKKALSLFPLLNTLEEDKRLEAVEIMLKQKG